MLFHILKNILAYATTLAFSKNESACYTDLYAALSTPANVAMNSLGPRDCQSNSFQLL